MIRRPPRSPLFPYTTLFLARSQAGRGGSQPRLQTIRRDGFQSDRRKLFDRRFAVSRPRRFGSGTLPARAEADDVHDYLAELPPPLLFLLGAYDVWHGVPAAFAGERPRRDRHALPTGLPRHRLRGRQPDVL